MTGSALQPGRAEAWKAAAVFALLTLLFTYPLWLDPGGSVIWMGSDTRLFAWTLSWDVRALTNRPWAIFDANIFYPAAHTLAYSENLIGSAILAAPILWLTGNPVVAINAIGLLSCLLCGIGAYWLARRVGAGPAGAFAAGIVFAFSPPRFFRIGQLHLTVVQWVPFGLASLHAYLDGGRRRDLHLAVLFVALQALSSGHGALFLLLSMIALVGWRAALGEPLAPRRRLRDFGVLGLALMLPVVWLAVEYRIAQREVGLTRTLADWVRTNAASFLASPSHVDKFIRDRLPFSLDAPEGDLFPGWLPLLLAPCAFAWRPRRAWSGLRDWARGHRADAAPFYALVAIGSLWLALPLGRPFGLWPWLYWLPGFNFIRVPSRFTILSLLALAVLVGLAIDRLATRVRPRWRAAAGVAAATLLLAEFAAMPLAVSPWRVELPAVDRWLATRPGTFGVAEVPMEDPDSDSHVWERRQATFMVHSMAHWQGTVHGFSGTRPEAYDELYLQLVKFPDEKSLQSLSRLGVRYVVVHTDLYPPGEWAAVQERISRFPNRLRLEEIVGAGQVYSLQ